MPAAPQQSAARRAAVSPRRAVGPSPYPVEAAQLARRWTTQLTGELHKFSDLRAQFDEWCEAANIAPVSDAMLQG